MIPKKFPRRFPWMPFIVGLVALLIAAFAWWLLGYIPEETPRTAGRLVVVALMLATQGGALLVWFGRASAAPQQASPLEGARAELRGVLARAARASGHPFPWPWRPVDRRAVLVLGGNKAGKTRLVRSQGGLVRALDGSGGLPAEAPTSSLSVVTCGEVVVLDTAGRFLDGGPQDADEWGLLLDLLRKERRLPAIESVALVVPAATLLTRNEAERLAWIDRASQRLTEVARRLRRRLPVHVVVSQVDAVAGFGALVGSLDLSDRGRPLGRRLRPSSAGPEAVRRELATELDGLRRALDRAVQERVGAGRNEEARGDMLALPVELAGLEKGLGELLLRAAVAVDPGGVWLVGEPTAGRLGGVAVELGRALGVEPSRQARPGQASGPAFATGLIETEIGRLTGAGTATFAAATQRRGRVALALSLAVLLIGGIALFGVARRELRHLDALRGGLQALAEVQAAAVADRTVDPWPGTARGAVVIADALWPGRLEALREVDLPEVAARDEAGAGSLWGLASGGADEAASDALQRVVDQVLLGEVRDALVQRTGTARAALAGADLRAERLGRAETQAMLLALDTHELARAWTVVAATGFGEDPALCGVPSLGALALRTAGLHATEDPALDRDVALVLAARVTDLPGPVAWSTPASEAAFAELGRIVDAIRPEVRTFNALVARVGDAVGAPPASEGLDAGTWPAEGLDWQPAGLDAKGCFAFEEALSGGGTGACAATAADPVKVQALYATHHEDQWRTWLSHLRLADVNERVDESPTDLATEIRRVLGPGRELDKVLQRVGRGEGEVDACKAEAPPAGCCTCACARRPWALAHQLGAGGIDAWGTLQKAAEELAGQMDGLDGAKAAPLVAQTLQGSGPFVALHDASRRVVTTVVATPPELPPGCACEGVAGTLAEAEVRARVEAITTALLSRAWLQTLKRFDQHLHDLWRAEVLTAWQPLAGRFPLDPDATDEAPPAEVAGFLGCGGKLGLFLTTHVRPLASNRTPPWGRAAQLAWTPEAKALLDGFDVVCRRADGADKPKRVQLGMQYVAGDPPNDIVGMRVTVDGRALTYRFGVAIEALPVKRDTLVQIEALRGNPPKVKCPRYAATTGDWPALRLLARPLVAQVRKAPPYDQKGLAFAPPRDLETCGNESLAPHKLTWQEEADGPAAVFYSLSTVGVPERLFAVQPPQ